MCRHGSYMCDLTFSSCLLKFLALVWTSPVETGWCLLLDTPCWTSQSLTPFCSYLCRCQRSIWSQFPMCLMQFWAVACWAIMIVLAVLSFVRKLVFTCVPFKSIPNFGILRCYFQTIRQSFILLQVHMDVPSVVCHSWSAVSMFSEKGNSNLAWCTLLLVGI